MSEAQPIELFRQDGEVFVTMLWPKRALIAEEVIGDGWPILQPVDDKVLIRVANGYAMYRKTPDIRDEFDLIESDYQQMHFTRMESEPLFPKADA